MMNKYFGIFLGIFLLTSSSAFASDCNVNLLASSLSRSGFYTQAGETLTFTVCHWEMDAEPFQIGCPHRNIVGTLTFTDGSGDVQSYGPYTMGVNDPPRCDQFQHVVPADAPCGENFVAWLDHSDEIYDPDTGESLGGGGGHKGLSYYIPCPSTSCKPRLSVYFARENYLVTAGETTYYYVTASNLGEDACPATLEGQIRFSDESPVIDFGPIDVPADTESTIPFEHGVPLDTCGYYVATLGYSGKSIDPDDGHIVGGTTGNVGMDNESMCSITTTTTPTTTSTLIITPKPGKRKGHHK